MTIYTCTRGGLTQRLAVIDLDSEDGVARAIAMLPDEIRVVYTDPVWDARIATAFRTGAGLFPCKDFGALMDRLAQVYEACRVRGAADIFVEHSADPAKHEQFLEAASRYAFGRGPMRKIETTYGSPKRPAILFHFGLRPPNEKIDGLSGPRLVETALRSIGGVRAGAWVVDPCIGQGMTSRVAHKLGFSCFGTELDPKRLAKTVAWLAKKGYQITEEPCAS
jgi:hypothetical protein